MRTLRSHGGIWCEVCNRPITPGAEVVYARGKPRHPDCQTRRLIEQARAKRRKGESNGT